MKETSYSFPAPAWELPLPLRWAEVSHIWPLGGLMVLWQHTEQLAYLHLPTVDPWFSCPAPKSSVGSLTSDFERQAWEPLKKLDTENVRHSWGSCPGNVLTSCPQPKEIWK